MNLRLTPKLTLIFVLFAGTLLAAVNLLAYTIGEASLKASAISELESNAGEKEAALNEWLDEKKADINSLAKDPLVAQGSLNLASPLHGPQEIALHQNLIEEFEPRVVSRE